MYSLEYVEQASSNSGTSVDMFIKTSNSFAFNKMVLDRKIL